MIIIFYCDIIMFTSEDCNILEQLQKKSILFRFNDDNLTMLNYLKLIIIKLIIVMLFYPMSFFPGPLGTTAFCKLAMNLPISDNDVSGMKILDMRTTSAIQQNTTAFPRQRSPPIVILIDGVFHLNNCYLAVQACRTRSIVDLKISHATIMAGIERNLVVALMDCLEVRVKSAI